MTTMKSIGRKLREYRNMRHLTIYQLGEKLGVSGKTVSAWENARSYPKPDMMISLCSILGIEVSDLYDESDLSTSVLSKQEARLLSIYRDLDDVGRARLYEYADDLLMSGKYTRKPGDSDTAVAS